MLFLFFRKKNAITLNIIKLWLVVHYISYTFINKLCEGVSMLFQLIYISCSTFVQVRKAEKEAILDAIREHGSESSEFVIRKVCK